MKLVLFIFIKKCLSAGWEKKYSCERECWDENGYFGKINSTLGGHICQKWNSKIPHIPLFKPSNDSDHNFCRNPDSDPRGPWCYTTSPFHRYQFCGIKKCSACDRNSDDIRTGLFSQPSLALEKFSSGRLLFSFEIKPYHPFEIKNFLVSSF